MHKIKLNYILFLIVLPVTAVAQLVEYPLERKPEPNSTSSKLKAAVPISLPFWDDFSFISTNSHAVDSLWINSNKVMVSDGQAIAPPTINVATFDGLNENGVPYSASPTDNLDFGYRDTLESQPIKMTEVPVTFRNSVFLSFFYQGGGNGEPPDPNDFLRLEFKNNSNAWETILTLRVEDDFDPAIFYDTLFRINQSRFYHDEFRFRFISFGRKSGRYDAWHLDYVYLNVRDAYDMNTSISDRAMTQPFTSVLGEYFSIPYLHFITNPSANLSKPFFELSNLKDTTFAQVVNYTSYFTITNYSAGTPTVSFTGVLDFEEALNALPSRSRATYQVKNLPPVSNFNVLADSATISMKLGFNSGDNDYDYYNRYIPIDFRLNDTLSHTFNLGNYYAYDDGTAEHAAGLTTAGNQLAYRFVMKTSIQDTLSDLSIFFPYFAGTSASTVTLFIFDNNNGKPGNLLHEQSIPVDRTVNNQFTKLRLDEGVIVQDTFYIGYREPFNGRVRIGLDKSNDSGDGMYFKATETGTWTNDWLIGSLMIRPHFGKPEVINGVPELTNPVSFYPNPSAGEFYVKGNAESLRCFNLAGQSINFFVEDLGDVKKISMASAPTGLYILRYRSGEKFFTEKMIITR